MPMPLLKPFFFFVLLLVTVNSCRAAWTEENYNQLSTGKNAKSSGSVNIRLNLPTNLNWQTRKAVLGMRTQEINKYPQLLAVAYKPYEPIWGALEDNKPWWGTAGSCVWGKGPRSIQGPAEESRFIINPYLLVGANPGTLAIWNPNLITKKDVENPNFPFFWQPDSLKYNPARAFATATYNISAYQKQLAMSPALKVPAFIQQFSLVAYNAKDFGYNYIYLAENKSMNIMNDNHPSGATYIKQMIHCGGTCGYPGGCNNMSPFMAEIDRVRFTQLPARATILLWKKAPQTVQDPADMTFLLEFR